MDYWAKDVAVIIITYNGKSNLKECIESLMHQTYYNFNLYLLDNASHDGSSDYVHNNYPWINIIRFDINYGFAEGYNKAIEKVNSKYIALLNDDTKVKNNWLEELINVIKQDESIFCVGSKILFYNDFNTLNHAGATITLLGTGVDIGFGKTDSMQYNKQKKIGVASGCSMLFRREIFQELGGFDKNYFAIYEDVDLCWRAWIMGYKVVYVPTSVVYHKFGNSLGKRDSPKKVYYCQKNKISNIIKNYELNTIIFKSLPILICFEIIRLSLFIKNKKIDNIKAITKGSIDSIISIRNLIKKRRVIQKKRKLKDKELFKNKLVLPFKESVKEFIRLNL